MKNELSSLCNMIAAGFAFAIGFRGFDAWRDLIVSAIKHHESKDK